MDEHLPNVRHCAGLFFGGGRGRLSKYAFDSKSSPKPILWMGTERLTISNLSKDTTDDRGRIQIQFSWLHNLCSFSLLMVPIQNLSCQLSLPITPAFQL